MRERTRVCEKPSYVKTVIELVKVQSPSRDTGAKMARSTRIDGNREHVQTGAPVFVRRTTMVLKIFLDLQPN